MKKNTDIEIDNEIIKIVTHCANNNECKDLNVECNCLITKAESLIQNKVLFVNCSNNWCSHKMHYGDSTICNCSTRMEIYKKYKI